MCVCVSSDRLEFIVYLKLCFIRKRTKRRVFALYLNSTDILKYISYNLSFKKPLKEFKNSIKKNVFVFFHFQKSTSLGSNNNKSILWLQDISKFRYKKRFELSTILRSLPWVTMQHFICKPSHVLYYKREQ